KLEIMQREMESAIAKELYERAAELRDAIKQFKASGQTVKKKDHRTTGVLTTIVVLLSCSLLPWRRLTQAWSSARNVGRAKWRPKKNRQSGPEIRHSGADLLNAFRQASISPKGSRFSISASNRKLR